MIIQTMADRAQGLLKICATILPEGCHPELDHGLAEDERDQAYGGTEPSY